MLIAAGQSARPYLRMRDANIEQLDGVIGDGLRFFRLSMPQSRVAFQRCHGDILLRCQFKEQTLLFAVLRQETNA